jgi:hypothetical protein
MVGQRRWWLVRAGGGCLSRTTTQENFEVVYLDKMLVEEDCFDDVPTQEQMT